MLQQCFANIISHHFNIVRWLWRTVCSSVMCNLILSCFDRCVMVLIRGIKSKCPCPICLIPSESLTDHSTDYPRRTTEDAKARLKLYRWDHAAGEKALKDQSLRPVEVSFLWTWMLIPSLDRSSTWLRSKRLLAGPTLWTSGHLVFWPTTCRRSRFVGWSLVWKAEVTCSGPWAGCHENGQYTVSRLMFYRLTKCFLFLFTGMIVFLDGATWATSTA